MIFTAGPRSHQQRSTDCALSGIPGTALRFQKKKPVAEPPALVDGSSEVRGDVGGEPSESRPDQFRRAEDHARDVPMIGGSCDPPRTLAFRCSFQQKSLRLTRFVTFTSECFPLSVISESAAPSPAGEVGENGPYLGGEEGADGAGEPRPRGSGRCGHSALPALERMPGGRRRAPRFPEIDKPCAEKFQQFQPRCRPQKPCELDLRGVDFVLNSSPESREKWERSKEERRRDSSKIKDDVCNV